MFLILVMFVEEEIKTSIEKCIYLMLRGKRKTGPTQYKNVTKACTVTERI